MAKDKIKLVDRQLACMKIDSPEGQTYLKSMMASANFAFANRTVIMDCVRKAFEQVFGRSAREMEMNMVYDVSHNMAKEEMHELEGRKVHVLVHRKGATRAFPPHHPALPEKYRGIGQPVLIGGSMGTASYILTGTEAAMKESFGSTCHGAGRALSRSRAIKTIDSKVGEAVFVCFPWCYMVPYAIVTMSQNMPHTLCVLSALCRIYWHLSDLVALSSR